jgi:hypothetical protein
MIQGSKHLTSVEPKPAAATPCQTMVNVIFPMMPRLQDPGILPGSQKVEMSSASASISPVSGYESLGHPVGGTSSFTGRRRSNSGSYGAAPKIRRRNRLITSCLECRRRKLKCDKLQPCGNCTRFVRDCVYLASTLDPAAQLKLAEIKEKMGSLERTLEEDVAKRGTKDGNKRHSQSQSESDETDEESKGPEDEKDLQPTPMAMADAAYHDDADDEMMDLGIIIGKLRITERIGGFVRPKLALEVSHWHEITVHEANETVAICNQGLPGFHKVRARRVHLATRKDPQTTAWS